MNDRVYQFTFWMPKEAACDLWFAHFLGKGIPVGIITKPNERGNPLYAVWIRCPKGCAPDKRRKDHSLVGGRYGFPEIWEAQEIFRSSTPYIHPRVYLSKKAGAVVAPAVPVAGSV